MVTLLIVLITGCIALGYVQSTTPVAHSPDGKFVAMITKARQQLAVLSVKGRAPKTDYSRAQFGDGWANIGACNVREIILARDLTNKKISADCKVLRGVLNDPYTGQIIHFERGPTTSSLVQIDHVVALSNAWQTGAQNLTPLMRQALANDPLELLAVAGQANQDKLDGDAATWLPPNKPFRCQYVARQISIKSRYHLWVVPAEKDAMQQVLAGCTTS